MGQSLYVLYTWLGYWLWNGSTFVVVTEQKSSPDEYWQGVVFQWLQDTKLLWLFLFCCLCCTPTTKLYTITHPRNFHWLFTAYDFKSMYTKIWWLQRGGNHRNTCELQVVLKNLRSIVLFQEFSAIGSRPSVQQVNVLVKRPHKRLSGCILHPTFALYAMYRVSTTVFNSIFRCYRICFHFQHVY